jgi:redox-sensitive bicupin YhaK (pirin superfamily)
MTTQVEPNIQIRRANDRFHSDHGWLNSWHTFSFGDHYDPAFAGFQSLRVINDDTVAPNQGFGEHRHARMEIISYVISGQLQHQDSMGNGSIIKPGEFQYMSSGTGVRHSEFNPSSTEPVHFLQIWITPKKRETKPRYQELSLNDRASHDSLTLVASPDGRDNSIQIQQDLDLSFGNFAAGQSLLLDRSAPSHWLHLISGELQFHGETLFPGDGTSVTGPLDTITAKEKSTFLLFSIS